MRRSAWVDPAAVIVAMVCASAGVIGQQPAACSTQDLASRMSAVENLCRPPETTCDASCAGVLLSTFDECALDAATQARWAGRHDVCAGIAGHNAQPERESDQSWLRGDCRSGGMFACTNGATCVLRSSHHRRRSQQGGAGLCPLDLLPSRTDAVNAACCTAPMDDCTSGLPMACSAACAQVLVPYVDECRDTLSAAVVNWQKLSSALQTTLAKCPPPAAPPATPSHEPPLGPAYHRCTCLVGYTGTRCEDPSGKG